MIEAIMNLLLAAAGIALLALWISALGNSDWECYYGDCERCPYEGGCPWERRK